MDGELASAGTETHPSEAIANLAMSTRGFQLRWGCVMEHPRRIGRAVLLGRVWGEAPRL